MHNIISRSYFNRIQRAFRRKQNPIQDFVTHLYRLLTALQQCLHVVEIFVCDRSLVLKLRTCVRVTHELLLGVTVRIT